MSNRLLHCVKCVLVLTGIAICLAPTTTYAQTSSPEQLFQSLGGPQEWTQPERISSTLQAMLLLAVISLAPAVLMMTTSFVRLIVVLGLLRQAFGTQNLPPNQVITSIALFVSLLIMTPVWKQAYDEGIRPYSEGQITIEEAFDKSAEPIRHFMADQIANAGNDDDVYLFLQYVDGEPHSDTGELPEYVYYDAKESEREVPLAALLPAFMLSELKTAFLIGFKIFLPFVILDIVVATVITAMGMMMLPPTLISLPFKLMLFVLVDGWRLVIEMLLQSFSVVT